MRPMPVQWVTREMVARLRGPASLFRSSLSEAERERVAARLLVSSFMLLVSCLAVLLFGEWR